MRRWARMAVLAFGDPQAVVATGPAEFLAPRVRTLVPDHKTRISSNISFESVYQVGNLGLCFVVK
jgi:hypothetical protein